MTPKRRTPAIPESSKEKTQGRTSSTSTPIRVVGINPRPIAVAKPKKAKKELKVVLAPESRRLFKGMTFCKFAVRIQTVKISTDWKSPWADFVPNNTSTSGARRFRVNKAIEYGAVCSNDWTNDGMYYSSYQLSGLASTRNADACWRQQKLRTSLQIVIYNTRMFLINLKLIKSQWVMVAPSLCWGTDENLNRIT